MPDLIQKAPTGRAKCRGCGRAIASGALRFGESAPNTFGEGESLSWFHLACAAMFRPEKLGPVLDDQESRALIVRADERAALAAAVSEGREHRSLPRLARAERASSGRAHCRSCRELIPKGDWRFALQSFEEGRATPLGTIHASCALAYFGTTDVLERLAQVAEPLAAAEVQALQVALASQRPPTAEEVEARDAPPADEEAPAGTPGLAKAPAGGAVDEVNGVKRGA